MSVNNLFNNTGTSSSSTVNGVSSISGDLGSVLNSINSLALPLEQGVGNFSQLYTQVKQLNPQAQTSIPVNEAFYQAPATSLTGNFDNAIGGVFNQMPNYMWWILGIAGAGVIVWGISKKR